MAVLSVTGCSGIKQCTLWILPLFASDRRNITIPNEVQIVAPTVQQIENQHNPGEDNQRS